MSVRNTIKIKAIGSWRPEDILSNQDLEKMVDTTDEWIVSRTGIKERRILKGPEQGSSVLGINAIKDLCTRSNLDLDIIDGVICTSVVPDYNFPSTACLIARDCGIKNAFCFDLNATCTGYIYALQMARSLIVSGLYKNLLIVTAEKLSSMANYNDRASCILFGDAGTATWLCASDNENGIIDIDLRAEPEGAENIIFKAGGSVHPATHETVDKEWHYFSQDGRLVFKSAVTGMESVSKEIMTRNNFTLDDLKYLIPHQANQRIIDIIKKRMDLRDDQVLSNISHVGNTSSSSIPLCLDDHIDKIKSGDLLLFTAFGSGYTYGSALLRWD